MVQAQKLARAAETLTGVAKRVLDATPISEPWTVAQICSEMGRSGSHVSFNIVLGCLNTHKQAGLVKEPMTQYFQRVAVTVPEPKAKPAAPAANVVPLMSAEKITEREPLESIGAMAQRLREAGRALIMWAEDLEQVGIEYETRIEKAGQDSPEIAKLRQLQTILNSLR